MLVRFNKQKGAAVIVEPPSVPYAPLTVGKKLPKPLQVQGHGGETSRNLSAGDQV
jgi:hypothetical protein